MTLGCRYAFNSLNNTHSETNAVRKRIPGRNRLSKDQATSAGLMAKKFSIANSCR